VLNDCSTNPEARMTYGDLAHVCSKTLQPALTAVDSWLQQHMHLSDNRPTIFTSARVAIGRVLHFTPVNITPSGQLIEFISECRNALIPARYQLAKLLDREPVAYDVHQALDAALQTCTRAQCELDTQY